MNLNTLNFIWRNVTSQKNTILTPNPIKKYAFIRKSTSYKGSNPNSSSSSSSSSDSDDDKAKAKHQPHPAGKNETMTKLNTLLQQLLQNDTVAKKSDLKLARPKDKRIPKEERESRKVESPEKKLEKAVSDVAKDIGGDTKQTESELLSKLLSPIEPTSQSKSLNEIMKGMKIDRETKSKTKAEQVRGILQNMQTKQSPDPIRGAQSKKRAPQFRPRKQAVVIKNIDLFGAEPLGIFTNKDLKETHLKTWQKMHERELKLAVTHPPANYFQEMILWTEQGKLWKFPLDNEQGLEDERKVDFSKHIFLEEHLDPWCPQRGPIRHFMELVCVGLSKNSYLTVDAKKEHIEWFKNYFEDKKKLLQEVGALPTDGTKASKQKQIE